MDLLIRILEVSAIAIGVPLILRFFAKLFPHPPRDLSEQQFSFPELQKRYAKWELAFLIPFFSFGFLSGYLIYLGLLWILPYPVPQTGPTRYVMLPDKAFFMLPALFLGILAGGGLSDLLYRLLLGKRYAEYILYGNMKFGIDGWRVFKILALIIIIPSILLTSLAMGCYARFTDDQIITNRFWGIGEESRFYKRITRIKSVKYTHAPNGKVAENPYHVLHFDDGSIWSTRDAFYSADQDPKLSEQKEREIIKFIAGKCNKEIETYDFLEKEDD
jgi:hypothetical protein